MRKLKRRKAFKALSKYSSDGKAALYTLGFAYLFLIVEIVYKFKVERETCTWELLLLFLMFAMFGLFKKLFTNAASPKRFDGTLLPVGDSKEDKSERNKYYKFSACAYACVFSLVAFLGILFSADILNVNLAIEFLFENEIPNFLFSLIGAVFTFGISYLLSYMIDYLWYENLIAYANEEEKAELLEAPDIKEDFEKIKAQTKEAVTEEVKPAPKKRGRPPKKKAEEAVPENKENAKVEESVIEHAEEKPAPKRRGRPPKAKTLEKTETSK